MAKPYPKKGMPEKKPKKGLKRTPIKKKKYSITKISKKKKEKITASKAYYATAIEVNKKKNGSICRCENCATEIKNPTGRNVSHIIAGGSNEALYLDFLNHFILCSDCEKIWTDGNGGSRKDMLIYEESAIRKEKLTRKYYDKKHEVCR